MAPWACFKVLDFAGTHVAGEWHRATNGASLGAVNQGCSAPALVEALNPGG